MSSPLDRLRAALADRYVIQRELGAGGMATVYLAHDVRHDRDVAVKVLHPDLGAVLGAERFLTEIKTTAKLQHPHILPLLDSGEADGLVFYVMPLVEGETLRSRLERERQLPLDDAIRIASEAASALDYAHRHGVIHRDIKPENILLHDGRAVVADFGIALAVSAASGPRMTQTGLSLGTPQYMAPEQAMGERQIDARADIYALGAVTYEMLTGEPPFGGATVQAIVAKVLTEKPMLLTSVRETVPRHVEATVLKALAKLPADRFASCALFAESLARPEVMAASIAMTSASAVQRPRGFRRYVSASPAVWVLLAASALVAGWGWLRVLKPDARPVTKVHFVPGAGFSLGNAPQLTISNDGSRIAFVATDSAYRAGGGVRRIYVRSLDRVDPVPVAGTQNAVVPFFSPDGESIGFSQDGKLRTVSLRGGSVTTVCDWTAQGGATWGEDGSIVFVSALALYRVPAAGGDPQVILKASRRGGFTRPHFLPGSRALLAQAIRDSTGIVGIRLADTTVTRVLPVGLFPQYVSGGLLVYGIAEGSVLAAPFDAGTLRVTGPAEPIADQVLPVPSGISRFGVARNGTMAYQVGAAAAGREIVLTDRVGRVTTLPLAPRPYRFPRFSPSGRQLAFHAEVRGTTVGDLWRYTIDGGSLLRLTSDSISAQPEWTPDGNSLVYMRRSTDPGRAVTELYRISADGTGMPIPVLRRPQPIYESHITPDGRTIVFREDAGANNRDIFMAPLDSPTAVRPLVATAFDEKGLAMSPDGKWLAYASNESGTNEIYIRRIQEVSSRWPVSQGGGVEPRWARSGEVFFRRNDSVFVARVELGAEPRISPARALFAGTYASTGYEALWDVSPDGSRFVFVRNPNSGAEASIGLLMNWAEPWRARHR